MINYYKGLNLNTFDFIIKIIENDEEEIKYNNYVIQILELIEEIDQEINDKKYFYKFLIDFYNKEFL